MALRNKTNWKAPALLSFTQHVLHRDSFGSRSSAVDNESETVSAIGEEDFTSGVNMATSSKVIDDDHEVMVNLHPDEPSDWNRNLRNRPRGIRKLIRRIQRWREERNNLSRAEKAFQAKQKKENESLTMRMNEADLYGQIIINTLTSLGYCERQSFNGQDRIKREYRFDYIKPGTDAFEYHIDGLNKPFGSQCSYVNITDNDVMTEIMANVGHMVTGKVKESGCWFIVEIASRAGIPAHVDWRDMMDSYPESAKPLTVPMGATVGGKKIYRDLDDFPHAIIGGTNNSGKTVLMLAWICALITRDPKAERVKMIMVDLKQSTFPLFDGIPHMVRDIEDVPNGICIYPEQVEAMINWVELEVEKRTKIVKRSKCQNIREYNASPLGRHNKLPYVVVFFDELARLVLKKKIWSEIQEKFDSIANISRAYGIHFVLATQYPKSDYITPAINVNCDARIAFRVPASPMSQIMIMTGNAATDGLKTGEYWFVHGSDRVRMKAPDMSRSEAILEVVSAVKSGKDVLEVLKDKPQVTIQEIAEWAVNYNNGSLKARETINQFQHRASHMAIRELLSMMEDEEYFTIDSYKYRCVRGANKERRLESVPDDAMHEPQTFPEASDPA